MEDTFVRVTFLFQGILLDLLCKNNVSNGKGKKRVVLSKV